MDSLIRNLASFVSCMNPDPRMYGNRKNFLLGAIPFSMWYSSVGLILYIGILIYFQIDNCKNFVFFWLSTYLIFIAGYIYGIKKYSLVDFKFMRKFKAISVFSLFLIFILFVVLTSSKF